MHLKLEKTNIKLEKKNCYLQDKDKEIEFLRQQLSDQMLESERLSDENNHLIKELEYLTKTIHLGDADYKKS
jgi:hypothetical protein